MSTYMNLFFKEALYTASFLFVHLQYKLFFFSIRVKDLFVFFFKLGFISTFFKEFPIQLWRCMARMFSFYAALIWNERDGSTKTKNINPASVLWLSIKLFSKLQDKGNQKNLKRSSSVHKKRKVFLKTYMRKNDSRSSSS